MSDTKNAPDPASLPTSQVPTGSATPVEPVVLDCSIFTSGGGPGPMSAGVFDPDINLTISTSPGSGEPLYRRDKTRIGFAKEFVVFNGYRVVKEVAIYVQSMIAAAAAETPSIEIAVTSGFRTMADQQRLYNLYKSGAGNPASGPGNSNHQGGIAVDFNVHNAGGRYEWMVKNAWKYGFIRTVKDERWHWEYWGDWAALGKPDWANHTAWGPNGHQPRTMFSRVERNHKCFNDGNYNRTIKSSNYWNNRWATKSYCQNHSDGRLRGATNSWIGPSDEHLPDKFDREFGEAWRTLPAQNPAPSTEDE